MKCLLMCLAALLLCGCRSFRYGGAPEPSFSLKDDLKEYEKKYGPFAQIDTLPQDPNQAQRNKLIAHRLVLIDMRYIEFIKTMTSDRQLIDSAADMLALGLNLAGVSVGGTDAKTALAAIAAGVTGSKTILDKNFYMEKTVPALVATMNAERKAAIIPLLKGMKQEAKDYTLGQALVDLQNYYFAGTLFGAIQAIQTEAGAKEQREQQRIETLQPVTKEMVATTGQLTDAIGKLQEGDLPKAVKAVVLLNPTGSTPATLQAAKDELQHQVRNARTPELLAKVQKAFTDAGISY